MAALPPRTTAAAADADAAAQRTGAVGVELVPELHEVLLADTVAVRARRLHLPEKLLDHLGVRGRLGVAGPELRQPGRVLRDGVLRGHASAAAAVRGSPQVPRIQGGASGKTDLHIRDVVEAQEGLERGVLLDNPLELAHLRHTVKSGQISSVQVRSRDCSDVEVEHPNNERRSVCHRQGAVAVLVDDCPELIRRHGVLFLSVLAHGLRSGDTRRNGERLAARPATAIAARGRSSHTALGHQ